MDSLIDIDIKEVKSPSQFTARIVLPWESEAYEHAFRNWQDEMEVIEQNAIINHEIHTHDICAVKSRSDDQWHRVRVEKVLYTGKGPQASCYFVDSGEQQLLLVHRLFKLPEQYQKRRVPFQVQAMKLWGVQPLTLVIEATDTGIHVPQRPAKKWDSSAETYFSQMISECEQAKVLVKEQESSGRLLVILYLQHNGRLINVNSVLVKEEYACALDTDVDADLIARHHSVCVTNPDNSTSSKHRKQQQCGSQALPGIISMDADARLTKFLNDSAIEVEEPMTEDELKSVMSKIHRVSIHKKDESDTEALNCSQRKFKVRSRPVLGSKRNSGMDSGICGNDSVAEVRSPTHADALQHGGDFHTIPVHCSADSDSSSYSELQSFNLDSKQSEGLTSRLKVNGTSPGILKHAVEVAASGHTKKVLSSTPCTPVPPASIAASCRAGVSGASPASAAGVNQLGQIVSAGRGRGLRKFSEEDFVKAVQAMSSPQSPKVVTTTEDVNTAGKVSRVECDTVSSPDRSAFASVGEHTGVSFTPSTADPVPQKNRFEVIHEFHKKKMERGNLGLTVDGTAADKDSPRLVDIGKRSQDQKNKESRKSSGVVGEADCVANSLRAIDLNMESSVSVIPDPHREQPKTSTKAESLISLLSSQSRREQDEKRGLKVPLVWRPDRAMPKPLLGTMAWGIQLPQPVFDVDEIPLNSIVKDYMKQEEFNTPRAIQAHTWPTLMRGRHIIGITPRHSGKTTAYLPPLVSELLKFTKYQKLPKGMGPKAVILVPSCKKADAVHHYVLDIIQDKTTFKVLCIYGSEDHQVIPLLRGCDLLIATPHCLLRMLNNRYTHLDRLCHLVLDGAEVMVEDFADEVQGVMEIFGSKLAAFRHLPVTRQVMAFGSRWSPAMAAFQRAFQPDPVLVFASRLEASVYGRVEQVVHMCHEKMHLATLKAVLQKLMDDPDRSRIVIVASNDHSLVKVYELLKSLSVFAQVIDFRASHEDIDDHVARWMDQSGSAVLVVTDNNVTELRLTSADVVVHFDIPNSQTKFGNRLALMLDHFQDSCYQPLGQSKRGLSHLLVTNLMLENIHSLHSFLLRSGATIPSQMTSLLEGMQEGRNQDEHRTLCMQLKQFGWCRDGVKCECRHLVLPCDVVQDGSPESWIPATGMIKIRILNVADTNHYYAMLLEHQEAAGQARQDLQSRYTSLTMDLAMYLSSDRNQVPFSMEQGQRHLAAVKDSDGIFHRARILSIKQASLKTGSRQVEVLYVDEGRKATVRPDQLLKLSASLQSIPPLAVEVFICRVKPVDGDTEWTRSSTAYVKNQLKDKDLIGNVILRMKNTLWLDPLAEQTRLQNVKTSIISMIVRPDLLKRGYAHDNPDHVKSLYKVCKDIIPIEKKLYRKYFNLQGRAEIGTETLRSDEEYHDVYVSVVDDPHHFFVQKLCNQKPLEKMEQELQKYMVGEEEGKTSATETHALPSPTPSTVASPARATPTTHTEVIGLEKEVTEAEPPMQTEEKAAATAAATEVAAVTATSPKRSVAASDSQGKGVSREELFEQGCLCVAKFASDGKWYRASILEKVEEGWNVFFVDHGERNVVADSDLHPIPPQFCKLPAQAIECGLGHISPIGKEWSENSGDLLWDLANTVIGDRKHLCAQVLSTERSEVAGATKYIIEIFDTSSWNRDMRFSQELVWALEATAEDSEIRDLFPKVTFSSRRLYSSVDAKICDLCAALYWSQDENKRKQLTKLLSDVLGNLAFDSSMGHSGLKQVVQLIGYLRSWDSQSSILSALVRYVQSSPQVCATVLGRQLMLQLVFCMEQARHPDIQLQAVVAASQLAKIDGFTPCLDKKEIILAVKESLMSDDPTPEMLKHACTFLAHMLTHGAWIIEDADAEEMIPAVFNILAEISDPDILETLLDLVAAATTLIMFHPVITREKHIQQILNFMREAPSQRCVFHCGQACLELCRANRRHKRILLEGGLVIIIKDLLEGGLQNPARQLCEELNKLLAVSVPQHEALSGIHVSSAADTTSAAAAAEGPASGGPAVIMPLVKWSQNTFRVLLTVAVEGAKESDFTITSTSVFFRCENGGKVYGFDYELFDSVVPDKCRVIVHQAEVVLSMAKDVKGMWSRLLRRRQKFSQLIVDYDKLVDSSDSELEEPENVTMLSQGRQMGQPPEHLGMETKFEAGLPACDEDASNSQSDAEEELFGSDSDDERFQDTGLIDPLTVMEDLISSNDKAELQKETRIESEQT